MASSPLIVKICGITSLADGLAALDAGADWLGFIRWPKSSRFRPLPEAAAMLAELRRLAPRPFEAVGVYVDASHDVIAAEFSMLGLDRVQLHGGESPEFAAKLAFPLIKAIRAAEPAERLALAGRFPGLDLLVDAYNPNEPGGTGQTYDYGSLAPLVAARRVIVAGGLHPGNVGDMVRRLGPWGVDVSSGVEISPGIKDPALVRDFIRAARGASSGSPPHASPAP